MKWFNRWQFLDLCPEIRLKPNFQSTYVHRFKSGHDIFFVCVYYIRTSCCTQTMTYLAHMDFIKLHDLLTIDNILISGTRFKYFFNHVNCLSKIWHSYLLFLIDCQCCVSLCYVCLYGKRYKDMPWFFPTKFVKHVNLGYIFFF